MTIGIPYPMLLFPQVQIVGRTPGATIFMGTDREASIFNMKQRTIEITDNVSINLGKHLLTAGTHNELYAITYGFVNSWNGRIDYPGIDAFLRNDPSRVRGSYNYVNNTRDYILSHPSAVFHINFYSAYIQDEIQVSDHFRVTPGLRADYSGVPGKQILSQKTRDANPDVNYGTSYTYTPLNRITGDYLSRVQLSPRIGFRADLRDDRKLVLRAASACSPEGYPLPGLAMPSITTATPMALMINGPITDPAHSPLAAIL